MSFNLQSLRQEARTRVNNEFRKAKGTQVTAETLIIENNVNRLNENKQLNIEAFDIFLSHSFRDADVILGILEKLNELGYSVYIDWITDNNLDRSDINKDTSNTLKLRMNQSKSLLFATTAHSSQSKWMPWELGYMDGRKDRAAILPIFQTENESSYNYKGQEYLGIYPYCIQANFLFTPDKEGLWIFESVDTYILFDEWLKGKKPTKQ